MKKLALAMMLVAAPAAAQECTESPAPMSGFLGGLRSIFDWRPNWCSAGSQGNPGWAVKDKQTTDSTAGFKTAHDAAKAGRSPLPANASDYVYVMVGGLFTEHYPGYMTDNIERLQSRGLDVVKVGVDTDAGVATNAKTVRDAVLAAAERTGKQVVLMGHSKGGVDSTAALSLYPELTPHIRAMIAMQAPYGGTPIASDIAGCPRLSALTEGWVRRAWAGDPAALKDLTYEARKKFLAEHPYPSSIPTVSLATSRYEMGSVTRKSAWYMRYRYGLKSDGLVPAIDAEIPGSRVIRLDDMDHAEAALRGVPGFPNYGPGDVTEALIAVALGDR